MSGSGGAGENLTAQLFRFFGAGMLIYLYINLALTTVTPRGFYSWDVSLPQLT